MDEQIQEILTRQNIILSRLESILSFNSIINNSYFDLKFLIDNIKDFDLSQVIEDLNNNSFEIINLYKEIYSLLNSNKSLYNFLVVNYTDLAESNIVIDILDDSFQKIDSEVIIKNNLLLLNTNDLINNKYYIKIYQNLNNTRLLSNIPITFLNNQIMSDNISKLDFSVNNENILNEIINNKLLTDSFIKIGNEKHHIIKYGVTILNGIKKLSLLVYPRVLQFNNIFEFYKYLFDDQLIELNLTDYNISDISEFYFNDAEKNNSTGEMIIYDKRGFPKYNFTYELSDNIERRVSNG